VGEEEEEEEEEEEGQSRIMKWVGHVARIGERRGAYRVLVKKPKWKSIIGRTKFEIGG
jgi:hypothetical protein